MDAPPLPAPDGADAGSPASATAPPEIAEVLEHIEAQAAATGSPALAELRPILLRIMEARNFSGPLPPPDVLREYEEILHGSAHRIFTMAETQQSHRIRLESLAVPAREKRANRGQIFALTVSLAGLAVAAYAVGQGEEWAAIAIGGADLAVLAGLFLSARVSVIRSLRRKRPEPPAQ